MQRDDGSWYRPGETHVRAEADTHRMKLILVPGAPKAGTTSLVEALCQQPGVVRPKIKEPGYLASPPDNAFCRDRFVFTGSDYLDALGHAEGADGIHVDGSQILFTAPREDIRIPDAVTDIACVVMLRDEVERIKSNYRMDVYNGWVDAPLDMLLRRELDGARNAYGEGPRYLMETRYARNIETFVDLVGRERVFVFSFEDIAALDLSGVMGLMGQVARPHEMPAANRTPDARPGAAQRLYRRLVPARWRRSDTLRALARATPSLMPLTRPFDERRLDLSAEVEREIAAIADDNRTYLRRRGFARRDSPVRDHE